MPTPSSPYSPDHEFALLFERDFDPVTFERGLAYAHQSRATIDHVEDLGRGELDVSGRCRGSRGRVYQVSVCVELDPASGLQFGGSSCTCPVGTDCKHAVALLLTFLEQLPEETDTPNQWTDEPDQESSLVTVGDDTLRWLALLDQPTHPQADADVDAQFAPQPRLVYLFQPDRIPTLSLGKCKPLKKGGLSKPTSFKPQPHDLSSTMRRDFIRDEDETPLRLFFALQSEEYNYYYQSDSVSIKGETGALLLMRAAATGRLYLKDEMQAPLAAERERPLNLKWVLDERGMQHLAFDLPAHVYVLPTWPPHFFDPQTHGIGLLASPLPENVFRKMMLAPPLNQHEAALVRERLRTLLDEPEQAQALPLPSAVEPVRPAAPPRARLRLAMGSFRHESLLSLVEQYPIAELELDYVAEGVTVNGSETPELMFQGTRDGETITMRRDLESERAIWKQLQAVGLESFHRRMPSYHRTDATGDCLVTAPADARGWLPLLQDGLIHVEDAGIEIEYADDFPFELATPDDWFVAVDEQEGNDWFDLDLGVVINGEKVSLVPPLIHLLKEQPRILQRLDAMGDEDTLPLRIDNRRLLPVPAPRLRNWLKPLLEFIDEDRPRMSRHHAAALAAFDDLPTQWLGGEQLRELGKRLRDFTGIEQVSPAAGFNTTLRGYQQAGLSWLQFLRSYGFAGILADDMGLGKTVQTLAHIQLEKAEGRADRPSLVIAPTSLLPNWANEARQFAPDLNVLTLHGPNRASQFDNIDEADLILTTYPLLVRDQETLLAKQYHVLVLDEAQFIKNPKAQSHRVARKLDARHRLSLTGTPLENHLGELWAQFDFLMPGLLGQVKRFNELFRSPIEKQGDTDAHARLKSRVAPFMLRRTKEQVLRELPPRTEIVRWVELEGPQRDLYESLRVVFDKKLREALQNQGIGRSQIMILDALLKLRQACCDPRLVKLDSARKVAATGAAGSAKLTELMTLLDELVDEGRRILLFSQFTSMLGLIEAELVKRKLGFTKLTGQTRDRDTPVRAFQNGEVPIFMISLKAGGTGLNLTAADTVIHYDPWWNPAVEAQATARAHRIGQDKPVFVYKLLGRGTVEEKILALQDRKRGLADQLLTGKKGDGSHLITADDLDVLFQPLA